MVFATVVRLVDGGPAPGDTVPGGLTLPWMWQATVQQDPPGPASILAGGDSLGFRGVEDYDAEGKVAAVGRDGDYRMLLYADWSTVTPGQDVLLSPDGRYAAQGYLAGSTAGEYADGLDVVDLTTGRSTKYTGGLPAVAIGYGLTAAGCCAPAAWAPDGRSLLVETTAADVRRPGTATLESRSRLGLLDLATNTVLPIGAERPADPVRQASRGAFAPDGQHLVVSEGDRLRLIDRTGKESWTTTLGDRRYLAGAGAFSADGARIAIAELTGCLDRCDRDALAARTWKVSYLDAATGQPATGPDLPAVTAMAIRALGWTRSGELVVTRHEPENGAEKLPDQRWSDIGWEETGHITLVALCAGGAQRTLLDPPGDVTTMDVAADLVRAGSFGGPAPRAAAFPARPVVWWVVAPAVVLTAVALLTVWLVIRRRRRPVLISD
ncbi:hypothetical protein [Actinoplanes awajinensis]|uniref:hypothetical protein n=1 Tax=Actinoplanes awajinensis TaxID=135946 RepID=UPI0012FCBC36|nr:hypothetical protein [Actinoplanes awajinensis]